MDSQEALKRTSAEFESRLREVDPEEFDRGTPCDHWTVHDLVEHVIRGNWMGARLLAGATTEEALAPVGGDDQHDPVARFVDSARVQLVAFAETGALERVCHHPVGDISGAQLLGFRIGDLTLHTWDLARAAGVDESLDPALVELVWNDLAPMAPMIGSLGVFGSGPSGQVAEDAPLQLRLLDLTGRRP